MRGHMRRRGDAWELRVFVGRDAVTGREHYATRTIRAGQREAQRAMNEMVVAAERGTLAKTRATFGELLDTWLEHASRDFSPKTVVVTRRSSSPISGPSAWPDYARSPCSSGRMRPRSPS